MNQVRPWWFRRVALAALLCCLGASAGLTQQPDADSSGKPAEVAGPTPIPAAQISDRAVETAKLLRRAAEESTADEDVKSIENDVVKRQQRISELQEETSRRLSIEGATSRLEETAGDWQRAQDRLQGWLRTLTSRAEKLGSTLAQVRAERQLWELTQGAAADAELPPALTTEIRNTLTSIDVVEKQVRASRDRVLDLQTRIGQAKVQVDEALADLRDEIDERRKTVVGSDSAPLWKALGEVRARGSFTERVSAVWRINATSVRRYVEEQKDWLLWELLALFVLVAVLIFLRQKSRLWVQQDRSLESTVALLDRPLAAAVVIGVLLAILLDPMAPHGWRAILAFSGLLAILRLLPKVIPAPNRSWAYLLALVFLLQQTVSLTPEGGLTGRLALLLLSVTGIGASLWIARARSRARSGITGGWSRAIKLGARFTAVLFAIGALSNILGDVGFASLLVTGTVRAILSAILFLVAAVLLRAIVRVMMLLPIVRRMNLVSRRGEIVRRFAFRTITMLAVVGWVIVVLMGINFLRPTIDSLTALLTAEFSIGNFSITPADVLIFPLIIWISFKISRLLCFVLDADVLPRMTLPRGVPAAVTRLSHYSVIVIGVVVAFMAAGFNLDRIAIVFGALGVGIGFGLQSVVNNFVSGMILLFERPIKVGDRIQLATVEGHVEHIGLRASVVRSFQGAEIIVPNANLVSTELINWTLQDDTRRMEIPVGVAYGTDFEKVQEILVTVAEEHQEVATDPGPQALFMGFGESSLDFLLRAWTTANQYMRVSSELRVAMGKAIKEAGIEIPFPQRDLHLRSIDDGVDLSAGRARKSDQ